MISRRQRSGTERAYRKNRLKLDKGVMPLQDELCSRSLTLHFPLLLRHPVTRGEAGALANDVIGHLLGFASPPCQLAPSAYPHLHLGKAIDRDDVQMWLEVLDGQRRVVWPAVLQKQPDVHEILGSFVLTRVAWDLEKYKDDGIKDPNLSNQAPWWPRIAPAIIAGRWRKVVDRAEVRKGVGGRCWGPAEGRQREFRCSHQI